MYMPNIHVCFTLVIDCLQDFNMTTFPTTQINPFSIRWLTNPCLSGANHSCDEPSHVYISTTTDLSNNRLPNGCTCTKTFWSANLFRNLCYSDIQPNVMWLINVDNVTATELLCDWQNHRMDKLLRVWEERRKQQLSSLNQEDPSSDGEESSSY